MQPLVRGDQWPGIAALTIQVNGSPPVAALASARMQFRADKSSPSPSASLATADGSIAIVEAANWELTIPPLSLPLTAGTWYWDLETTDATGAVKTYLAGTLQVIQDITR